MKQLTLLTLFVFLSFYAFSQSAVRGIIYDDSNGETIPFADVVIQGTGTGTTSDLDGAYSLKLDPGTYTLVFSYLGYSDLIVSDVVITDGEVNLMDVRIGEDTEQLAEVVITAKQVRNTEAAVLTLQKKSVSFLDGLSSQTFSKTGDGDAAAAIKRVPGVSVEGGKHVYVRGLGDRYTKTILNGMDIPGLDPDKNTVQMDIFPTNLIDNLIVYKTFTPNLPGDFTGGLVEITTKDFPEEPTSSLSLGLGYNSQASLNNNFVTYDGGGLDWLAFDDGNRELPIEKNTIIADPTQGSQQTTDVTRSFNPVLGANKQSQFLDRSAAFSMGNQKNNENNSIGYTLALNYSSSYNFDDFAEYGVYRKPANTASTQLQRWESTEGSVGIENHLWSVLLGTAIKFDRHKISLSALRSQNGEIETSQQNYVDAAENPSDQIRDILQYSERSVTNFLLQGKHSFNDSKLTVNWKISPTFSSIEDPDIRFTSFEVQDEGIVRINPSVGSIADRTWRFLKEDNYSGKTDITYEFNGIKQLESKFRGGLLYTYKTRDYDIINYVLRFEDQDALDVNGDPNKLLASENIWTLETDIGSYYTGGSEPANAYSADQKTFGAYVMAEMPLTDQLKAIYGVRVENFQIDFTGQNNNGSLILQDSNLLNETNFLPSIAFIYELKEDMNLRASYSNTLARPTFKEKSLVQIRDRISGRTFIGNLDLVQSEISNYDLRWEYFLSGGQVISISGFYKSFKNPIELVVFDQSTPDNFTPRNVGDGTVFGLELEFRKNLEFISLPRFSISSNLTLLNSSVEMNDIEFNSRVENARDGETIDREREMFGQSPYIVNAGLGYTDIEKGWETNLSFNIQGERIALVGIGQVPDVYEQSFESLNFKVSKRLPSGMKVSFQAENILDADREFLYKSFESDDQVFARYNWGRTFSLGVSLNLR